MISNITKSQAQDMLGYTFQNYSFDLHWTDYEDTYYVINLLRNKKNILELGTYLGYTSKNILLNTNCENFTTIDIVKELHDKVPKFQTHELLSIIDSGIMIPEINTINIKKLHKTTTEFFKENDLIFDGIFIDASHDMEDVLDDSYNAIKACSKDGIVVWHDVYNFDNSCPKCQAEPPNRGVVDALNKLPYNVYKIEKSWVAFYIK
jgi:predicted O-methyltransferase YrrM